MTSRQPWTRRCVAAALLACFVTSLVSPAAQASVNVTRSSDENPMKEVYKAALYGGLTGLLLGGAIAVADDENHNDGELLRWGFASGTLLGAGLGLWWVNHRPQPSALLEFRDGALRARAPIPQPQRDGSVRLAIASLKF